MFIKEAWFWRGFQSAVFYYISCAPCTKVLDQRRKKQNAARARAEKAAKKAAQARLVEDGTAAEPEYDHPLPSSTNPFWEDDIKMGPGPPSRRRHRQAATDARGKEKGRESKEKTRKSGSMEMVQTAPVVTAGSGDGSETKSGSLTKDIISNTSNNALDSIHPNATEVPQTPPDTNWNRQRYQREDEPLWGLDGYDHNPPTVETGVSLSRNSSSRRRGQQSYYYARNPAVNDLHPPVVSTAPRSRLETQWMLQPPPRAKVIEGKEKATRDRSETISTRSSRANSQHTGRNTSKRNGDRKSKRAGNAASGNDQLLGVDSIPVSRSRGSSNQSMASSSRTLSRTPSAQRGENALAPSSNKPLPANRSPSQRNLPPPISIETIPSITLPSPPFAQSARPGLQTIPSTSLAHSSKHEWELEKSVSDPTPLLPPSTRTDGEAKLPTTASSSSSNILQPVSNGINKAGPLNDQPIQSTEASTTPTTIAAVKATQEKHNEASFPPASQPQKNGWQFPGAEDGWKFPPTANGGVVTRRGDEMMAGSELEGAGGGHQHQHRWSMDI